MKNVMEKFEECLFTWSDLPDYVYTEEYKKAFIEFVEKKIAAGQKIEPILAIMTLHHETDDGILGGKRVPYFKFNRD